MFASRNGRRFSLFNKFFAYFDARRPSEKLFLGTALLLCLVAGATSLFKLNDIHLVSLPTHGGVLEEGMVGAPRFVNPVLAITRVDQDLTTLIYSSLMKLDENGVLVPEIIDSIDVSEDGKVYHLTLKSDITFSDDVPLTTADVAFTIELIQNAELKSPLRSNWSEVGVEVIDDREINLVLDEAYTPFAENLTIGILPKHIWSNLSIEELPFSQYNTQPIGAGPYVVDEVTRSEAGLITTYKLVARKGVADAPLITEILVTFFQNEEAVLAAYREGAINSTSALTNQLFAVAAKEGASVIESPLPRVFGVFMNQNRSAVLRDSAVREALEITIDREALIERALAGYGEPTALPVPTGFHEIQSDASRTQSSTEEAARNALLKGGWKYNEAENSWSKLLDGESVTLSVTLSTANNIFFSETAAYLKETWENLGIETTLALYEQADVVQTVIRPRDYQLLLFGTDIGRSLDLYPFWHSSQREDPGLNVALYTNIAGDDLLEKYRVTKDQATRERILTEFTDIVLKETPAIFLFNPSFVYLTSPEVTVTPLQKIGRASDRFATIRSWYIEEETLWPLFIQK